MKRITLLLVTLIAALAQIEGKTFSQCELARSMHNIYGFSKQSLGNWLCLVKHESNFKTTAIKPHNVDGTKNYGLFQINSKWCSEDTHAGGKCHVLCKSLLDSNIADDIKCITLIYKQYGFAAWDGWKKHCRDSYFPNVNTCF